MKINSFLFLFVILFLSCNSKEKSISEKEEPQTSRILNQELKNILPELIQLQNQMFKSERQQHLNVSFVSTENYLYTHISDIDCEDYIPQYVFDEKLNSNDIRIYVSVDGFKPEEYFDLKGVEILPALKEPTIICDDFNFLFARFVRRNEGLKLESINTSYSNAFNFYAKEDSVFLQKIGILIEEPEPFPKLEN